MHSKIFSNKKFNFSCLIVIVCSLMLNGMVHAAIQAKPSKSYPPYPDVWGYDLSEIPAVKWGKGCMSAYAMNDGDIWFLIDHSYKKSNLLNDRATYTDEKYVLIKFFKGEQLELSEKDRDNLFVKMEGKYAASQVSFGDPVFFKDGSKLQFTGKGGGKLCYIPSFSRHYFTKTDSHGQEKQYSILVAPPQVNMHTDQAQCEAQGAPFLYEKLHILMNAIPLEDDTFIAYGFNLILRFDKDLKTKFKPVTPVRMQGKKYIARNFFVIDYSLIENLEEKFHRLPVPLYQSIQDGLLLHFHNQYPN